MLKFKRQIMSFKRVLTDYWLSGDKLKLRDESLDSYFTKQIEVFMKISLIRHAKVNMNWPRICNSIEFDNACKEYDLAGVFKVNVANVGSEYSRLYVSSMHRSKATARELFPDRVYCEIEVEEVPLRSFVDCSIKMPLWIWNIMGRLQWFLNSSRQKERRIDTVERCKRIIRELESKNENCIVVTHGFFMRTFIKCLKRQGYTIANNKMSISNLHFIYAER